MAAFSNQQHNSFLLDPPYLPNTPIEMPFLAQQFGEISNASYCFPHYFSCESIPEASTTDTRTYESSCSLDSGTKVAGTESQMDQSSVVVEPKPPAYMEKKRKTGDGACFSAAQSKDTKESKGKKQKQPSNGLKGKEQKKPKHGEKKETNACEEPPTGYIHVRARRGQATDSHSLAERVRREKISVRMKVLQGLVPGCDKVVGKALMLDEIINYVQSLQNQVEFLSMKLASVNPMLYDFGVDFDDCMNQQEKLGSIVQPFPSVHQTNHILPITLGEATSNYQLVNTSAPNSQHGHGPTAFSQDNTNNVMQADDHRQGFLNQVGFNNMFSFQ